MSIVQRPTRFDESLLWKFAQPDGDFIGSGIWRFHDDTLVWSVATDMRMCLAVLGQTEFSKEVPEHCAQFHSTVSDWLSQGDQGIEQDLWKIRVDVGLCELPPCSKCNGTGVCFEVSDGQTEVPCTRCLSRGVVFQTAAVRARSIYQVRVDADRLAWALSHLPNDIVKVSAFEMGGEGDSAVPCLSLRAPDWHFVIAGVGSDRVCTWS